MQRNWKRNIATVSQGEARILQDDDSDVSLEIPKRSNGVFVLRVHTDLTRFKELVPQEECIIGPMVEVENLKPCEERESEEIGFVVKIPHCIKKKKDWDRIKVRLGDVTQPGTLREIPSQERATNFAYYTIHKHFLAIHTRHFCLVMCTICKQEVRWCPANA